MSRDYNLNITITCRENISDVQAEALEQLINDNDYFGELSLFCRSNKIILSGVNVLCGGTDTKDAHNVVVAIVRKQFPNAIVRSEWYVNDPILVDDFSTECDDTV